MRTLLVLTYALATKDIPKQMMDSAVLVRELYIMVLISLE